MTSRVAHFVDSHVFGGVEQVVLLLLAGLDRKRWTPLLYCHEHASLERLVKPARAAGVECRTIPAPRSLTDTRAWRGVLRQLAADRPCLLHAHLGWPLGCRHGLLAARLARIPRVVATAHLYVPMDGVRFRGIKQRIQAATVDRYVAVSHEVARRFEQDLRVDPAKLRVVHNGIAIDRPAVEGKERLREDLLESDSRPVVLMAARLHAQKGQEFLIRAAARVPDAVFVLAGDGPERCSLEALARDLGVVDRVRFLGHRDDVPALLQLSDLMVLPSLYEGLPISVLEAMAAVKPVVATAIGGTVEAVVQGETGLLVPPRDPAALAAAIRTLLRDREYAARLAAAGRARVEARFSREAMVAGICRVYDEVLG